MQTADQAFSGPSAPAPTVLLSFSDPHPHPMPQAPPPSQASCSGLGPRASALTLGSTPARTLQPHSHIHLPQDELGRHRCAVTAVRGPVLPHPVTAQSWPGRPWSAAKGSGTPAFGGPSAGCKPLLPRGLLASPGSGPWASSPATCVRPPCWPQLPGSPLLPAWAWPSAGAPSAV